MNRLADHCRVDGMSSLRLPQSTGTVCKRPLSLTAACRLESDTELVFAIGGAQVYRDALPLAHRIYLTLVEAVVEGDTYFPLAELQAGGWNLLSDEPHAAGPQDDYPFRFQIYQRRDAENDFRTFSLGPKSS